MKSANTPKISSTSVLAMVTSLVLVRCMNANRALALAYGAEVHADTGGYEQSSRYALLDRYQPCM